MTKSAGSAWVRLDALDLQILKRLELDARIQNLNLANAVGLSPSGTLHRVRRLEKMGVIRGYVAMMDESLFAGWVVLWGELTLTAAGRADQDGFEARLHELPEVVEARRLVGRSNYLVRIAGRDVAVWPALLQKLDPDGAFIQKARVQVEDAPAKPFAGLPQLNP